MLKIVKKCYVLLKVALEQNIYHDGRNSEIEDGIYTDSLILGAI